MEGTDAHAVHTGPGFAVLSTIITFEKNEDNWFRPVAKKAKLEPCGRWGWGDVGDN